MRSFTVLRGICAALAMALVSSCSTLVPNQTVSYMPPGADEKTAVTIQFAGNISLASIDGKDAHLITISGLIPYSIKIPEGGHTIKIKDQYAICLIERPFYAESSPYEIWSESTVGGSGEFYMTYQDPLLRGSKYGTQKALLKRYYADDPNTLFQ